ncbi:uncharacterized protein AB675_4353 [Cyphellophora attinorum]|uniref:Uncharacterized protein n=1 Tax=Cyphellophora attinorum TaxID=1664694 RepID=A0A0N1H5Y2_9EURO|nr:uncharacterized protein AB675_4353 [Phialophora attinorum]KPI36575.1 hypothetical protein AB675_4353 [Phialophora attinorum]
MVKVLMLAALAASVSALPNGVQERRFHGSPTPNENDCYWDRKHCYGYHPNGHGCDEPYQKCMAKVTAYSSSVAAVASSAEMSRLSASSSAEASRLSASSSAEASRLSASFSEEVARVTAAPAWIPQTPGPQGTSVVGGEIVPPQSDFKGCMARIGGRVVPCSEVDYSQGKPGYQIDSDHWLTARAYPTVSVSIPTIDVPPGGNPPFDMPSGTSPTGGVSIPTIDPPPDGNPPFDTPPLDMPSFSIQPVDDMTEPSTFAVQTMPPTPPSENAALDRRAPGGRPEWASSHISESSPFGAPETRLPDGGSVSATTHVVASPTQALSLVVRGTEDEDLTHGPEIGEDDDPSCPHDRKLSYLWCKYYETALPDNNYQCDEKYPECVEHLPIEVVQGLLLDAISREVEHLPTEVVQGLLADAISKQQEYAPQESSEISRHLSEVVAGGLFDDMSCFLRLGGCGFFRPSRECCIRHPDCCEGKLPAPAPTQVMQEISADAEPTQLGDALQERGPPPMPSPGSFTCIYILQTCYLNNDKLTGPHQPKDLLPRACCKGYPSCCLPDGLPPGWHEIAAEAEPKLLEDGLQERSEHELPERALDDLEEALNDLDTIPSHLAGQDCSYKYLKCRLADEEDCLDEYKKCQDESFGADGEAVVRSATFAQSLEEDMNMIADLMTKGDRAALDTCIELTAWCATKGTDDPACSTVMAACTRGSSSDPATPALAKRETVEDSPERNETTYTKTADQIGRTKMNFVMNGLLPNTKDLKDPLLTPEATLAPRKRCGFFSWENLVGGCKQKQRRGDASDYGNYVKSHYTKTPSIAPQPTTDPITIAPRSGGRPCWDKTCWAKAESTSEIPDAAPAAPSGQLPALGDLCWYTYTGSTLKGHHLHKTYEYHLTSWPRPCAETAISSALEEIGACWTEYGVPPSLHLVPCAQAMATDITTSETATTGISDTLTDVATTSEPVANVTTTSGTTCWSSYSYDGETKSIEVPCSTSTCWTTHTYNGVPADDHAGNDHTVKHFTSTYHTRSDYASYIIPRPTTPVTTTSSVPSSSTIASSTTTSPTTTPTPGSTALSTTAPATTTTSAEKSERLCWVTLTFKDGPQSTQRPCSATNYYPGVNSTCYFTFTHDGQQTSIETPCSTTPAATSSRSGTATSTGTTGTGTTTSTDTSSTPALARRDELEPTESPSRTVSESTLSEGACWTAYGIPVTTVEVPCSAATAYIGTAVAATTTSSAITSEPDLSTSSASLTFVQGDFGTSTAAPEPTSSTTSCSYGNWDAGCTLWVQTEGDLCVTYSIGYPDVLTYRWPLACRTAKTSYTSPNDMGLAEVEPPNTMLGVGVRGIPTTGLLQPCPDSTKGLCVGGTATRVFPTGAWKTVTKVYGVVVEASYTAATAYIGTAVTAETTLISSATSSVTRAYGVVGEW